MSNIQDVIGDYRTFLSNIIEKINEEDFDMRDFSQLDVLCYRTSSQENYARKKQELSNVGTLLSEVIVSNRPIATFRLNTPILYDGWRIDTIELPAPKEGSEKPEGLEHIQFVLFDDLSSFMRKYSKKEFDTRAIERGINPMIGYKFKGGSVKFHIISLPAAIYLENKLHMSEIK